MSATSFKHALELDKQGCKHPPTTHTGFPARAIAETYEYDLVIICLLCSDKLAL